VAASSTEIANLALAHLGQKRIETLSEETKEARWANQLYPAALAYVTEAALWGHARRTLVLEVTDNDRESDYQYAYVRPSDCLSFKYILPYEGRFDPGAPINFEREGDCIYTDEETARGVYVRLVETTTKFAPSFDDAVALQLAQRLVAPLALDKSLKREMADAYRFALEYAVSIGACEQLVIWSADEAQSEWHRAR